MNWKISAAAAALLVLPLGSTYAAVQSQDNNPQASKSIRAVRSNYRTIRTNCSHSRKL